METHVQAEAPTRVYDRSTDQRLMYIEQKLLHIQSRIPGVWTVAFGVAIGIVLPAVISFVALMIFALVSVNSLGSRVSEMTERLKTPPVNAPSSVPPARRLP